MGEGVVVMRWSWTRRGFDRSVSDIDDERSDCLIGVSVRIARPWMPLKSLLMGVVRGGIVACRLIVLAVVGGMVALPLELLCLDGCRRPAAGRTSVCESDFTEPFSIRLVNDGCKANSTD